MEVKDVDMIGFGACHNRRAFEVAQNADDVGLKFAAQARLDQNALSVFRAEDEMNSDF